MSTIKVDTLVANDGTSPVTLTKQSAAKAWADFDGAVASSYIQGSLNFSSLTDNGTGDYSAAYSNSFSDANYAFMCSTAQTLYSNDQSVLAFGVKITGALGSTSPETKTTSATRMLVRYVWQSGGGETDVKEAYNTVHGDLA